MRRTPQPRMFRLRNLRLPTGTALAVTVAVAGLAAVPAYGADAGAGRLEVHPASAAPGAEVTVGTSACDAEGTATGDASAVGADALTLVPGTPPGNVTGRFRVP